MSDSEIYLLIKYIKSVLWRVTKRQSYIEDARCLKGKQQRSDNVPVSGRFLITTFVVPKFYFKLMYCLT